MRRHDAVKLMEAGQAIGSYNARRWIGEIDVPTAVVVTERDRAIDPARAAASWRPPSRAPWSSRSTTGTWRAPSAEFGPVLVRAVDSVHGRIAAPRRAERPAPWVRSRACACVEVAGIGPGPFCAMVLADLGADVIRVDRPAAGGDPDAARFDILARGRRSVGVDLKAPAGPEVVLRLVERADALLEGFRPGVAERLGIGPEACLARNPRLVYGRMTGWGQDGPAGRHAPATTSPTPRWRAPWPTSVAPASRPRRPSTWWPTSAAAGCSSPSGWSRACSTPGRTGEGQVVDAAMVDGTALLMAPFFGASAMGFWSDERGTNLLDSGAPYYDVYRCADGVELGGRRPSSRSSSPRCSTVLELDPHAVPDQNDRARWPELRQRHRRRRSRSRRRDGVARSSRGHRRLRGARC